MLVPPAYISLQQEGMIQVIHEFETKGGRIVMFEYQLNKGSLIHFEDRTYDLFRKKNRGEKIFTE